MFDIGGANFFGDIHMYTYVCTCLFFYVCKSTTEIIKLKFLLEPKFFFAKNGSNVDKKIHFHT